MRLSRLLPLVISLSFGLAGCSSTPETEKPLDLPAIEKAVELQEVWRNSVGNDGAYAFQPAIVGPSIFAAAADGDVARFDGERRVWIVDAGDLSGGVAADATHVVVGGPKGLVTALSAEDGKVLWHSQLSAEIVAPAAFADGLIIVRSGDNRIHALERNSGQRKWTYQRIIPPLSIRSTAAPLVTERFVLAGFPGGKLVALGAANGNAVWEGAVALPKGSTELERIADVVAQPVAGAREICAVAHQGRLACFDVINGNLLWAREVSSAIGLALDGKAVYVTDDKGIVQAFDRTSGGSLWKQDKLVNRVLTRPLLYQGFVVLGDGLGELHFLDAADGSFRGRFTPQLGGIVAPLTSVDGSVVLQTRRGYLVAVQAR
jgi:outer membrane protein assembly factor BamB